MVVGEERLKDERVSHQSYGTWAVQQCWEPSSRWSLTGQLYESHGDRLEVWTAYEKSFPAAESPQWKK